MACKILIEHFIKSPYRFADLYNQDNTSCFSGLSDFCADSLLSVELQQKKTSWYREIILDI